MNWLWKARIQKLCALIPWLGESVYYQIQRRAGRLRHAADPEPMVQDAAVIAGELRDLGFSFAGARILEVGTGRRLDMPICFYLCGASRIITFDLHRYLREELALETIDWLRAQPAKARQLLGPVAGTDFEQRLHALREVTSLPQLLETAGIEYRAPADTANTGLPDGSIDLQFSYTVFEHIPRPVLAAVLEEGSRLLSAHGLICHHIDPSDHFAHVDPTIPFINFLRYSEREWQNLAGNPFSYHNRMRATEFLSLYQECSQTIVHRKDIVDARSLEALRNGFPVHESFRRFSPEELCTVVTRLVSRPREPRRS